MGISCTTKRVVCVCLVCICVIVLFEVRHYWHLHRQQKVLIPVVKETSLIDDEIQQSVNVNQTERYYLYKKMLMGTGRKRRLPTVVIFGVQKCGTWTLLRMLQLHPDVVGAPRDVHYFDFDENYSKGLGWYLKQMPLSNPGQITVEKTPGYCYSKAAPSRIFAMNPTMKLIVILRNPTERAISQYVHSYMRLAERNLPYNITPFEELALKNGRVRSKYNSVNNSVYVNYMVRWLDVFPRHQIHVVDGDRLKVSPAVELHKVENFLGLKNFITETNFYYNRTKGFYCMKTAKKNRYCMVNSKGRKKPDIDTSVIDKLNKYYKPYNRKLEKMLGQTFNWP
ncbi:heparan sulfate glucosamine 3-O-sulfotransferase 1-like [Glandiceps talaboti]